QRTRPAGRRRAQNSDFSGVYLKVRLKADTTANLPEGGHYREPGSVRLQPDLQTKAFSVSNRPFSTASGSSYPSHSLIIVAYTRRKSVVIFRLPSSRSVRLGG